VALLLLAVGGYLAFVTYRSFKDLEAPARRRAKNWTLFATCSAIAVLLLARFGLHWIGAIGAAGWALARGAGPTIFRLLHAEHGKRGTKPPEPAEPKDASRPAASSQPNMSRAEALEVLGVADGASQEEILAQYRALMRKVHPDAPGGSTYLATKLNQAKDALLG
jgi:hypothetical protein